MDITLTDTETPAAEALTTTEAPAASAATAEATALTALTALTRRDRAILKAVANGRAELVYGAEPDLLLDGRCCCDQVAAHRLARAGLIAPAELVPGVLAGVGQRVPARLTAAGTAQLAN
jgi:hypothetical protein